jgi:ABC-type dipeptide/oligopeptide/nickel transport system permease subunit
MVETSTTLAVGREWRLWPALRRDPGGLIGLIGLGGLILLALLAPILAPFDPTRLNYEALLQPPDPDHWFGTDQLGRDLLSRILWGGRLSLAVSFLGIVLGLVSGSLIGLVAGTYGGWLDAALMRAVDVLLAFPTLLLLLSLVALWGPGLTTLVIALGISAMPGYARLVRGSTLAIKNQEYIVAAQVIGASKRRIMTRHILPHLAGILLIYNTTDWGSAILLAAGLSFLGLGAQPPSPEWGAMLNAGLPFLREAWWLTTFPGLALFSAVLSINLLGEGLRDALGSSGH